MRKIRETEIVLVLESKEDIHIDIQNYIRLCIKMKLHLSKHIYSKYKSSIKVQ